MRLALPAVVLLLLCGGGCGPAPLPPRPNCGPPKVLSTNPALGRPGLPVAVEFGFDTACTPPDRIEATVVDPSNLRIDSVASLSAYLATVTFMPATGGAYHVTAVFQPNRGIAQVDVRVAIDRSAEPGHAVNGAPATPLELTDAGLVVAGGSIYRLEQGSLTLLRSSSGTAIARGDAIWVQDLSELVRLIIEAEPDGGTRLVRSPAQALPGGSAPFFPAADDVVFVQAAGSVITRASVTVDGGWAVRQYRTLPANALWAERIGNELLVVTPDRTCDLDLDAGDGGTPGLACTLTTGNPLQRLGGDLGGVWLTDAAAQTLLFRGPAGTLVGAGRIPATLRAGVVPIVVTRAFDLVPFVAPSSIELEYWGGKVLSASSRTVATTSIDGGVLIRRR